jgi:hypothetical protein
MTNKIQEERFLICPTYGVPSMNQTRPRQFSTQLIADSSARINGADPSAGTFPICTTICFDLFAYSVHPTSVISCPLRGQSPIAK